MESIHLFYNELEIGENNVFTANISQKMKLKMYYLKKIKNMPQLG